VARGFLLTAWARIHLGRLWSGNITRKPDHRIVDTGPYGLVRHPIYSGLILSACATAAMRGVLSAALGALAFALAFYLKARLEEQFLRVELGPSYDAYARRVGMLVPSLGR
jgi:protein-S-isoprenylcysteine O-methyltransferase Ste14